MTDQDTLRTNLQMALKAKNLKINEFAVAANIAPRTIYNFIRGNKIGKMAIAFISSSLDATENELNTPHDEQYWREKYRDEHHAISPTKMMQDINNALASANETQIALIWSVAKWVLNANNEK